MAEGQETREEQRGSEGDDEEREGTSGQAQQGTNQDKDPARPPRKHRSAMRRPRTR